LNVAKPTGLERVSEVSHILWHALPIFAAVTAVEEPQGSEFLLFSFIIDFDARTVSPTPARLQ
jgi:hypothetical protein